MLIVILIEILNSEIMKKTFLTFAAIITTLFASAQVTPERDPNEEIQDKIQQEPQPPAEIQTERGAKTTAERDAATKKQIAADAKIDADKARNAKAKSKAAPAKNANPKNGKVNPPQ